MARMSSQLERKMLGSFARGDRAMALADTGRTRRKQIMDLSVWNSVKDAKAPASLRSVGSSRVQRHFGALCLHLD